MGMWEEREGLENVSFKVEGGGKEGGKEER